MIPAPHGPELMRCLSHMRFRGELVLGRGSRIPPLPVRAWPRAIELCEICSRLFRWLPRLHWRPHFATPAFASCSASTAAATTTLAAHRNAVAAVDVAA